MNHLLFLAALSLFLCPVSQSFGMNEKKKVAFISVEEANPICQKNWQKSFEELHGSSKQKVAISFVVEDKDNKRNVQEAQNILNYVMQNVKRHGNDRVLFKGQTLRSPKIKKEIIQNAFNEKNTAQKRNVNNAIKHELQEGRSTVVYIPRFIVEQGHRVWYYIAITTADVAAALKIKHTSKKF